MEWMFWYIRAEDQHVRVATNRPQPLANTRAGVVCGRAAGGVQRQTFCALAQQPRRRGFAALSVIQLATAGVQVRLGLMQLS